MSFMHIGGAGPQVDLCLTDFNTSKFFKTDKRDDCGHLRLY